ncbi:cyclin-dependent kinase inhibitor 5-like [Phalaenopsis equestris]|uniref:cyclin-dependent kinase inhibitor 5-like n=1 Tax=Phalaenopsis equestris TaxID=78828 RepID=UPI0009E21454|nr:cyclin-dependent kinase inhibitor 5-like [Phalaenopsis equestris]
MGKYIRKAKLAGKVAVMEVSAQSSIGVRTRARTLALRRPRKPSSSSSSTTTTSAVDNSSSSSSSCYLQLRSRRLQKPALNFIHNKISESKICADVQASPEVDGGVETSFGENVLDFDCRDRNVRETTPCSLIRSSETIRTPGSTTRLTPTTNAFNRSLRNAVHQNIPNPREIEEFFAGTEHLQQKKFMEKYNFDPLNDFPLPGRYEWVKLDS